jgi:general secretion pathway protein E
MRLDRAEFERSLAARLIAGGKLDESAADRAMRLRASSEERLERMLTRLGLVHERDVAEAVSSELGLPLVDPADYPDAPVLESASPKFLKQAQVLPLQAEDAGVDEDVDRLRDLASEEPVIRLVNLLISRAVESRASDIHVEPLRPRISGSMTASARSASIPMAARPAAPSCWRARPGAMMFSSIGSPAA